MQIRRLIGPLAAAVAISGAVTGAVLAPLPAQAYSPTSQTIYQLPGDQACLKGRGNCAIYPKAAQLGSGRLVASFELSTVPASGYCSLLFDPHGLTFSRGALYFLDGSRLYRVTP